MGRRKKDPTPPPSELTPELSDELVATHLRNQDFADATAIACGQDPSKLDKWIRLGMQENAVEPYKGFAIAFLKAEVQIRADLLRKIREAKTPGRARNYQWLIARRFAAYNDSHVPADVLQTTAIARAGLSPDQKRFIIQQMLKNPTPPVQELLASCGYQRVELLPAGPEETANAEEERPDATH